MKLRNVFAVAAAGLLSVATAYAQDTYGSVWGGYSQIQDPDFSGIVTPPGGNQTVGVEFDGGYNIGAAIGRSFGDVWGTPFRGELEFSFGQADADAVFFSGNGPAAEANVAGSVTTRRIFANGLFDLGSGGPITPYLGGGIGAAFNSYDVVYGPGVRVTDDTETVSAQLIAGASYDYNDSTAFFSDVRFIRDFNTDLSRLNPLGGLTGTVEDDVDTIQVNFGVRFKF